MSDIGGIKRRIAEALGWSEQDANGFSLATLRDLVRPKHPGLADEITGIIARGEHVAEAAPKRKARRR